jgi:hypothetical protein
MEQQGQAPAKASTVTLENLAEAVTKATLRALEERKLVPSSAEKIRGGGVEIPYGPGGTVLGIVIPPWNCEPGESGIGGLTGLGPCHHHIVLGIIIMPKDWQDLDPGSKSVKS